MAKLINGPISLRAASLTLSAGLVVVVGTVAGDAANATSGAVRLGALTTGRIHGTYTRGADVTGRPRLAVDVSLDADSTAAASVANWVPIYLLDAATFASGAIDAFAEQVGPAPTVAGASVFGTPPFDLRGAIWMRVRVIDVAPANFGAITSLVLGGET